MSYNITEYSPRFKNQVAALRSRIFGGSEAFSVGYFEWKYEQNPYIGEPLFCVALLDGNVVGMVGAYGTEWRAGRSGNSHIIPCGGELGVDQEHQRHGLGRGLIDYLWDDARKKGYKYAMHLGSGPSSLRLKTGLQFDCLATYKSFQRNSIRMLIARGCRKLNSLLGYRLGVPFHNFDAWVERSSGSVYGALAPRLAEMSELVSHCCSKSATRHVRDARFYRWRFADPRSVYRFIFCEQGGSMAGFLVLHQFPSGGWTTVVDWEASTHAAWCQLLEAAMESKVHNLRITAPAFSEEQTQALLRMGFASAREGRAAVG